MARIKMTSNGVKSSDDKSIMEAQDLKPSSKHDSPAESAAANGGSLSPLSQQKVDLTTWPGWVELESEPAYFNVMLKDIGVRGVKVQEVISLDDDILALLPQPVHALIFLFRYRDSNREDPDADFPGDVWFARQKAHNACASHALVNIINNIPGLVIGDRLEAFKAATKHMTPLERGGELDELHFVRAVHNSFATENDLIAADQHLQDIIQTSRKRAAAAKTKKARAEKAALKNTKQTAKPSEASATRSSGRIKEKEVLDYSDQTSGSNTKRKHDCESEATVANTSAKRVKAEADDEVAAAKKTAAEVSTTSLRRSTRRRKSVPIPDEEAAYHFCAYMPIDGRLWKLDSLEPTPQDLGEADEWLAMTISLLQDRMAAYEAGSIEFNLMAVVHDPLAAHQDILKQNIKSLQAVEAKLITADKDWIELKEAEESKDVVLGISERFAISQADIDQTELSATAVEDLKSSEDLTSLLKLRKSVVDQQASARGAVRDEMELAKGEDEKAFHRRHDYAGFVRGWMEELAEENLLADLVNEAGTMPSRR